MTLRTTGDTELTALVIASSALAGPVIPLLTQLKMTDFFPFWMSESSTSVSEPVKWFFLRLDAIFVTQRSTLGVVGGVVGCAGAPCTEAVVLTAVGPGSNPESSCVLFPFSLLCFLSLSTIQKNPKHSTLPGTGERKPYMVLFWAWSLHIYYPRARALKYARVAFII